MNWLVYIGGGIVFLSVFARIMKVRYTTESKQLAGFVALVFIISVILTWIWICWKFIR